MSNGPNGPPSVKWFCCSNYGKGVQKWQPCETTNARSFQDKHKECRALVTITLASVFFLGPKPKQQLETPLLHVFSLVSWWVFSKKPQIRGLWTLPASPSSPLFALTNRPTGLGQIRFGLFADLQVYCLVLFCISFL